MSSPDCTNITLAILAGGAGSRMGLPKSQLQVHHQPILAYLLEHLQWPGPTLLVTSPGRQNPPAADLFDLEASDPIPNQGPLRGLLTALEHSTTSLVITCTTDMPLIRPVHLHGLVKEFMKYPQMLGLMFLNPAAQIEPFPSIFRTTAAGLISQQLQQSRRSVQQLAGLHNFATLPAPADWHPAVWTNLNNRNDLELFLSKL